MQTLVIGDIHGCYEELQLLLDKAGLAEDDVIISVGDLVDRGPETPQVLDFFRQTASARAVMGNHERKHMRFASHEVKLSLSQRISRQQFGDAYPEAVVWMGMLPLYIELPEVVITHGYMEPGLPPDQQHPSVLCGTMGGDKILRERYDQHWYELYDGAKPVIVGHHNYTASNIPFNYQDKVFGVDTNCVLGKSLTGLLLPSFQFISIPTKRGNMWGQARRAHRSTLPARQPKPVISPVIPWSDLDNMALARLIEKVEMANRSLMARIQSLAGYAELTPRQQAKLYSAEIGQDAFSILMQLARQEKLEPETARKMLRDPREAHRLLLSAD